MKKTLLGLSFLLLTGAVNANVTITTVNDSMASNFFKKISSTFSSDKSSNDKTDKATTNNSPLVLNKDYSVLKVDPSKTIAPASAEKPVVIEFFWYGCIHCYKMEPLINKLHKERNDFVLKRYPVAFGGWESGALIFFTLEEMGLIDTLHEKVFFAVQEKNNQLLVNQSARDKFLKDNGVDVDKFNSIYKSFSIAMKLNKAKEAVRDYKILASPTFVVNNTYAVDPGKSAGYADPHKNVVLSVSKLIDTAKTETVKK